MVVRSLTEQNSFEADCWGGQSPPSVVEPGREEESGVNGLVSFKLGAEGFIRIMLSGLNFFYQIFRIKLLICTQKCLRKCVDLFMSCMFQTVLLVQKTWYLFVKTLCCW